MKTSEWFEKLSQHDRKKLIANIFVAVNLFKEQYFKSTEDIKMLEMLRENMDDDYHNLKPKAVIIPIKEEK